MATALERLAECPRFGSGLGFVRCRALLDRLEISPTPNTVGITGSNGKGSTSAMLTSLLRSSGLKVGLYTSPHFLDPRERFQIDGEKISALQLEALAATVLSAAEHVASELHEVFARFELLTAMAWLYFQRERVEVAVFEVGIGGRFDTTRLARPRITAITSLDLEHKEILGDTLELIFADKLDLTTAGGQCFASLPDDSRLRRHCRALAELRNIELILLDELWPELEYEELPTGCWLRLSPERERIRLPLAGEWQARNAALAIAIAREVIARPIDVAGLAFSDVSVPGRFEVVRSSPRVIVDAAHTPDALAHIISQLLRRSTSGAPLYPERVLLVGVSENKPVEQMVDLLSKVPAVFFVSASAHGGAEPERIATLLRKHGAEVIASDSNLEAMVTAACAEAERRSGTVFALGGLFFAADVARVLRGESREEAVYL